MMANRFLFNLLVSLLMVCISCSLYAASYEEQNAQISRYLEQGQYLLALESANSLLQASDNNQQQAKAYGTLGNIQLLMHRYKEAEQSLKRAYELTEDALNKARYANSLGVLYHETNNVAQQESYFKTALGLAGNDQTLSLQIKLNALLNRPERDVLNQADKLLNDINNVPSATERTKYLVNLAELVKQYGESGIKIAQLALEKAEQQRNDITDKHLLLELLDSLADTYEIQGQQQRALDISEQASALSAQMNPDEVMINLERRKATIYQTQGRDEQSLIAFGKAVDYIQAIRMDIPVEYHDGKSSFRETLEPVYLGYATQLLKKAKQQDGDAKQRTLLLARQTVEQIKQTEMEDFFGGRCLIEGLQRNELDSLDTQAVILYPIVLSDSLELLVSRGKTVYHYSVPVSKERVYKAATTLANRLRNNKKSYQKPAENLYRWMIEPIEKDLAAADIKTIVVVPDGVLRLVPIPALFDGQQYVIEKYAVSVSPGMSLMGNRNITERSYRTLLTGLAKPGSVVEKLPSSLVRGILTPAASAEVSAERGLAKTRAIFNGDFRDLKEPNNPDETQRILRQPEVEERIKTQLSLPGVEVELTSLKNIVEHTALLNEQFTVDSFHEQLSKEPYEMVHIASHGIFSSNADESFLLAYDNLIKLDDLDKLLRKNKQGREGIELLTLSACETAEGDDRAPLGFTGAALKAKARSAVGSLWPISDEAAPILMASFYKHITQHFSKAEALRQAQLELLHNPKTSHPFYWSPFILVGNWL